VTLILSVLTPWWILQIGDRLVTLGGAPAQAWDALSNKQLVVRTLDGLLVFGYSGGAYLGDKPTDHVLAEILCDARFDWSDGRLGIRIGAGTSLPTKPLLHRLTEQLRARLADKDVPLWLDAAGVWVGKRGARPVLTSFKYRRRSRELVRQDSWDLLGKFAASCVPPSVKGLEDAMKQIHTSLHTEAASGPVPPDMVEAALVAVIRECAGMSSGRIGRHCMSVLIRSNGSVRLRYLPEGGAPQVQVVSASRTLFVPGTFAPWILTPSVAVPPRVMVGAGSETVGGLVVEIDGPLPPPEDGLKFAWSSQQRRDPPSLTSVRE